MIAHTTGSATLERWSACAAGAPPTLPLPLDRRRTGGEPRWNARSFPLAVCAGAAAVEGAEASAVVLAAYVALLARYSGEPSIVMAIATADGYGPARFDLSAETTIGRILQQAREETQRVPREPALSGDAFSGLAADGFAVTAHGAFHVAGTTVAFGAGRAPVDLALTYDPGASGGIVVHYRAELFDPATIERFAGHVQTIVAAVNQDGPVRTLRLLTDVERETQRRWNATAAPYRSDCTVIDLLREQVARTPDAIAVEYEGQALTYGQLDERASRLGSYLRARGIGPEMLVAIYVERSIEMLVAVLGIHYARAAYVPIDPAYPPDRIGFILSDAGVRAVVTQRELRDRLPPSDAFVVDIASHEIASAPVAAPEPANGDLLAYVIYTSGSTGRPKGVANEHRGVVNVLTGMQAHLGVRPGHRFVAVVPIAFDVSVPDMYLTLINGATVVIAPRETTVSPRALMVLMERSGATHMQATPSTWRMLVEAGWNGGPGITILCGGEALSQQLADQLSERGDALWNFYGPTEAAVWATVHRHRRTERVTIGRPMVNVSMYVLDEVLQQLPVGVQGELFIGGEGVARGYLHRPELTAERFLPDPYSDVPGSRMYRTGDLARFRADGTLEFFGRLDFQVKLHGHRIELGEIEAELERRDEVRAAVVTVRTNDAGDQMLVAYVTVEPGAAGSPATIRTALGERLPPYMIPNAIVVLDALPLNANGKVDRSRLPAPEPRREISAGAGRVPVKPRNALETRLTAIWEDVLDIRPIGVTDNFFDLGATSIIAARLFDRIERELGATLPLSPLFQAPTIEALAALIDHDGGERPLTSLVAVQPLGTKTPIFCVHGGAGTILHFEPLARRLGLDQPFYGLQLQGLYGDTWPHLSIEAMAAHYLEEIVTVQAHGPYVLAGYCFGAIVAFEMARVLEARGERVALLVNFNGPSPEHLAQWSAYRRERAWLRDAATREAKPVPARKRRPWSGLRTKAKAKLALHRLFAIARFCNVFRRPLPEASRAQAVFRICHVAEERYRPALYPGSMLIFHGAGLHDVPDLGWSAHLAQAVVSVEVPGKHDNQRMVMSEPAIEYVADRLRDELARALERREAAPDDARNVAAAAP